MAQQYWDGWDCEELIEHWGLKEELEKHNDKLDGYNVVLQNYISAHMTLFTDDEEMERVANDIRGFLTALIVRERSEEVYVWEGLLKIEDNFTFLKLAYHLIGMMWV